MHRFKTDRVPDLKWRRGQDLPSLKRSYLQFTAACKGTFFFSRLLLGLLSTLTVNLKSIAFKGHFYLTSLLSIQYGFQFYIFMAFILICVCDFSPLPCLPPLFFYFSFFFIYSYLFFFQKRKIKLGVKW